MLVTLISGPNVTEIDLALFAVRGPQILLFTSLRQSPIAQVVGGSLRRI